MYVHALYGWSVSGNKFIKWIKIVPLGCWRKGGKKISFFSLSWKYPFMLFEFCTLYINDLKKSI